MNNLGDYLDKKAEQLDLGRVDELTQVQKMLDEWYPGKCRAQSLNRGVLRIKVTSSSVANELRFKADYIISSTNDVSKIVII